ncbi:hypothetical protein A2348_00325 [Candidatus Uhrbacteria bacterium RIFOXYB12_FULL_58_10]|uniref:Uncharacterized protein n=1 Tax=Candidatus Uhrbacteria bacterium RIFOXYB2_FULL_57_15 TaxID=1802422 RepID=A0A1F7W6T2_9BACT|nr:MAG: hypothetical protein A2348_00325 [Candidatus Uhrbacteria bacterium RIFOXYB12_FULL_58_10]OGL98356.1 MAG: hypothetical protein A2304_01515 [Candidatus Uhrbacteria bacterium RIFOXYB2_FULL_57_15]OGM00189.1 MAG: hypothetical protein A2501_01440 [Candidatus Uhrbacteria bacterium RIFOXYC12_FULL_57_11]
MILLHRITPFLIGIVTALGFVALLVLRFHPFVVMGAVLLLVIILYARLTAFEPRSFQSWMLVGTPSLFLLTSFGLMLFLERPLAQTALAVFVSLFAFFFAEHVFSYVHVPVNYETYAIEHMSLAMNVASVFFVSVAAFGTRVFLTAFAPLWLLTVIFFAVSLFVIFGTLWASKVDVRQARLYALCGALLVTEVFMTVSYLPTGFYTNAALIALTAYLFLGLTRAHFVEKLSPSTVKRYVITSSILLTAILGTSQWT